MRHQQRSSAPALSLCRHALLLFATILATGPLALAGDWYVDQNYASCSSGSGSASNPFCTIGAAVAAAATGDTVHIAPGTYVEKVTDTKSLTFIGTGGAAVTTVKGSGGSNAFKLKSGTTSTFSQLTIANSYQAVDLDAGCAVAASDCTFDSNPGSTGGAIRALSSQLSFERCRFLQCSAGNGGAIHAIGGSLTAIDSEFDSNQSGNAASSHTGGGAVYACEGTVVSLERCIFSMNTTPSAGGAIRFSESRSASGSTKIPVDATLVDCIVTGNECDTEGGAIQARKGTELELRFCSFDNNRSHNGGAIDYDFGTLVPTRPHTMIGCRFVNNGGTDHFGIGGSGGALRFMADDLVLTDCVFIGNFAGEGRYSNGIGGGVRMTRGTVTRCSFVENRAEGTKEAFSGGFGGGAYVNGDTTFTDCVFERNLATNRLSNQAGNGGGLMFGPNVAATLRRCTLAGNRAETTHGKARGGAHGGGIETGANMVLSLDHCIIASNFAQLAGPDLRGRANLIDYNCIGDTQDAILLTTGPNDLLDVDPEFVDDVSGDFSLRPTSPCIDSGDPSLHVDGKDVQAFPRTLDGDLDGQLRIDRDGHEFSHVRLALSGSFTPGGVVTVTSTGLAGFATFLIVGDAEGRRPLNGFGELYVELLAPFVLLPWLPLPSVVDVDVDPAFPVPATFYVQEFAYGGGAGNLSNLVRLDIQ
ncbi:MAG: hypothetical protein JNL90_02030 [Planctomycetes bacterium]|nr:hypothetical protein [Planctomycetota bacterium]